MVTKRSQRRPDSSSLRRNHGCGALWLSSQVAHPCDHGGRSGGEAWAVRYPKETAPAAGGRATELSQSPPARRQGVPSGTNIRRCVIAARHKGVLADTVDPAQRFRELPRTGPPRELT